MSFSQGCLFLREASAGLGVKRAALWWPFSRGWRTAASSPSLPADSHSFLVIILQSCLPVVFVMTFGHSQLLVFALCQWLSFFKDRVSWLLQTALKPRCFHETQPLYCSTSGAVAAKMNLVGQVSLPEKKETRDSFQVDH